jgi:antitoxin component YwqK of YwqJK toxin-antitoxin module
MKKFILCVATGYVLVFILFMALPQMMEESGGIGNSKGGGAVGSKPQQPLGQNHTSSQPSRKTIALNPKLQTGPSVDVKKRLKRHETGPVETFYRNGTLSSEWILDSEGSGFFKTYTPEGRPWMTIPFARHVLEGELKTFYPEGPLFSSETYLNGRRAGVSFWRYKNGNSWLEVDWNSEGAALLTALYSEDGKRVDVLAVRAEQSTGYFKAFDERGQEVINLQQVSGEQKTVLKSYYQSGVLSAELGLKAKKLSGRAARYYADGTLWMEMEFMEKAAPQNSAVYFENKELLFKETSLSEPQGGLEWKTYYPDGNVFWVLTKSFTQDKTLTFWLTTHWQDEALADANKQGGSV